MFARKLIFFFQLHRLRVTKPKDTPKYEKKTRTPYFKQFGNPGLHPQDHRWFKLFVHDPEIAGSIGTKLLVNHYDCQCSFYNAFRDPFQAPDFIILQVLRKDIFFFQLFPEDFYFLRDSSMIPWRISLNLCPFLKFKQKANSCLGSSSLKSASPS